VSDPHEPGWRPARPFVVAAIAVRVVIVIVALHNLTTQQVDSDYVPRIREIAGSSGAPWRDFEVEYPPLTTGLVLAIGNGSAEAIALRLLVIGVLADAVVALALLRGFSGAAAGRYLVFSIPALVFVYLTLDLVPLALVVLGLAATERRRQRGGGMLLGLAVLAKVWPIVLVPGWWIRGRPRAVAWSLAAVAMGSLAWLAFSGAGGFVQVATFRGTPGWQVESTVGVLLWIFRRGTLYVAGNTFRIGAVPGWATILMGALLVAAVGGTWWRARRDPDDAFGTPALAAVAALMVFSPVLSYPYPVWLLPFAALCRRRVPTALAVTAVALTSGLWVAYAAEVPGRAPGAIQVGLLVRNLLLIALVFTPWFPARGRRRPSAQPAAAANRSSNTSGQPLA